MGTHTFTRANNSINSPELVDLLLRPLAGAKYCNLFARYAKMSNIIPKYHNGQYISETRKERAKVTMDGL